MPSLHIFLVLLYLRCHLCILIYGVKERQGMEQVANVNALLTVGREQLFSPCQIHAKFPHQTNALVILNRIVYSRFSLFMDHIHESEITS